MELYYICLPGYLSVTGFKRSSCLSLPSNWGYRCQLKFSLLQYRCNWFFLLAYFLFTELCSYHFNAKIFSLSLCFSYNLQLCEWQVLGKHFMLNFYLQPLLSPYLLYLVYVCTLLCMLMWRLGVNFGYHTGIHLSLTLEPPLLGLQLCAIIPGFLCGGG